MQKMWPEKAENTAGKTRHWLKRYENNLRRVKVYPITLHFKRTSKEGGPKGSLKGVPIDKTNWRLKIKVKKGWAKTGQPSREQINLFKSYRQGLKKVTATSLISSNKRDNSPERQ
ncbi:hypothetical protein TNCT_166601 [Trichonephila clavata]|uniref:Uncharacterized protein n=1 Tax=Trichonephila clavata TaxID=2740835 RepID=A0A8X6G770_TRICU|nr:hypothetical protein TNCT_166601 [Trichonephila clavata]